MERRRWRRQQREKTLRRETPRKRALLFGGDGQFSPLTYLSNHATHMGNLKKKRRLKMNKHKRRKRSKASRHKKRLWG
jgi:hypothetical protein